MTKKDITELLRENPYPGRGIVLGRNENENKAFLAYFIMGRSENSRNRVFVKTEDGIKTKAHNPSKMTDPSLVIYNPVRHVWHEEGPVFIVTNGDQTDTLRDYIVGGKSYLDALRTREYEPDAPNFTPRISGLLFPNGTYMLSILKTLNGDPGCCLRHFYTYDAPLPGTGHFIHTYSGYGDPLPSFYGEPLCVTIENGFEDFTESIWEAMDNDNKVALFACEIDIETGEYNSTIINKLQESL